MGMMTITSLEMGSHSFNQQSNNGIMGDHHGHVHDNHSNFPYSDDISSPESDFVEDGTISSGSSSPVSPVKLENGPLGDMSSLLQQLPIKRGLSRYFNGKSQSYTSLSNVTSLEDLAKPENPYKKKLKSCKSYVCFSEAEASPNLKRSCSSKLISKNSSRGFSSFSPSSTSSMGLKRNGSSFISNNKPPTHPTTYRSGGTSSFNSCTTLFA